MVAEEKTQPALTEKQERLAGLKALRAPFPKDQIGKLPRSTCKACSDARGMTCEKHKIVWKCELCGGAHSEKSMHIDYVGHADLTARLLEVDPEWTWEPFTVGTDGLPALDRAGNLWIRLTVCGVTRIGVGDGKQAKEWIGDALRNAGMRFGMALELWAKGDRDWAKESGTDGHEVAPAAGAKVERSQGLASGTPDPFATPPVATLAPAAWNALKADGPGRAYLQAAWNPSWPTPWEFPDARFKEVEHLLRIAAEKDVVPAGPKPGGEVDPA